MQTLIVSSILPNLSKHLRRLEINPKNQDIKVLLDVFKWVNYIPLEIYSNLFNNDFFPKWTNILWTWLKSDQANLDEITQWYTAWKQLFHTHGIEKMACCKENFRIALDMMNQGHLKYIPTIRAKANAGVDREMRFIDLVETLCAENNIEFSPLNKRRGDRELYRMGHFNVYIEDGVLYCLYEGRYQFMSVDEALVKCL